MKRCARAWAVCQATAHEKIDGEGSIAGQHSRDIKARNWGRSNPQTVNTRPGQIPVTWVTMQGVHLAVVGQAHSGCVTSPPNAFRRLLLTRPGFGPERGASNIKSVCVRLTDRVQLVCQSWSAPRAGAFGLPGVRRHVGLPVAFASAGCWFASHASSTDYRYVICLKNFNTNFFAEFCRFKTSVAPPHCLPELTPLTCIAALVIRSCSKDLSTEFPQGFEYSPFTLHGVVLPKWGF